MSRESAFTPRVNASLCDGWCGVAVSQALEAVGRDLASAGLAHDVVDALVNALESRPGPEADSLRSALTTSGRELLVEVLGAVLVKGSGVG